MSARRVGLLGGTFDPIHLGHLDAGRAAQSALALDPVVVVPSSVPPHRPQPAASGYHRFAMVALAIADLPRWRASDVELQSGEPSFTVRTLDRLRGDGYAPTELFFVLGADAFAEIETWRDFPAILDRAHFAVVSRPGWPASLTAARLPALAPRVAPASEAPARTTTSIFLIDAPTADVAATAIRERAGRGDPLDDLVPAAVARHIDRHGLYRAPTAADREAAARAPDHPVEAGRLHGQD